MKVIIDRFEGDLAVVELNEKMYNIPRALLPDAHEGDTVEITVTGKTTHEDTEDNHDIFERLRKKSRSRNRARKYLRNEAGSGTETNADEADKICDDKAAEQV